MSATASAFRLDIGDSPCQESATNSASTAITSFDFGLTLDQVRSLSTEEDEDDRPSLEALERTIILLRKAAELAGMRFPRAIAATGPGRSVRLIWMREPRELRLMIGGSAANRSYIYWRTGPASGVDENITPQHLAAYLNWLTIGS
jgi:hypothetical protein